MHGWRDSTGCHLQGEKELAHLVKHHLVGVVSRVVVLIVLGRTHRDHRGKGIGVELLDCAHDGVGLVGEVNRDVGEEAIVGPASIVVRFLEPVCALHAIHNRFQARICTNRLNFAIVPAGVARKEPKVLKHWRHGGVVCLQLRLELENVGKQHGEHYETLPLHQLSIRVDGDHCVDGEGAVERHASRFARESPKILVRRFGPVECQQHPNPTRCGVGAERAFPSLFHELVGLAFIGGQVGHLRRQV